MDPWLEPPVIKRLRQRFRHRRVVVTATLRLAAGTPRRRIDVVACRGRAYPLPVEHDRPNEA
jgi:hypothetical protein